MLETIQLTVPPELADIVERVIAHRSGTATLAIKRPSVVDEAGARVPRPPGGPWLTTAEFATRSGITIHAVSNRARRGKLRSVEVRDSFGQKRYLVAEAELDRLEQPPAIDLSLHLTPSEFGQRVGLTAKERRLADPTWRDQGNTIRPTSTACELADP